MKNIKTTLILLTITIFLSQCSGGEKFIYGDTTTTPDPDTNAIETADDTTSEDEIVPDVDINISDPTDDTTVTSTVTETATETATETVTVTTTETETGTDTATATETTTGTETGTETETGTDTTIVDTDADTIADDVDNCPTIANTNQKDSEGLGEGDLCNYDFDADGDGLAVAIDPSDSVVNNWAYVSLDGKAAYVKDSKYTYKFVAGKLFTGGLGATTFGTNSPNGGSGASGPTLNLIIVKGVVDKTQAAATEMGACPSDDYESNTDYGICITSKTISLRTMTGLNIGIPNK